MRTNMSVMEVKEQLPSVTVRYPNGTVKRARIAGGLHKFARLIIVGDMVYYEASWSTVTRAVNSEEPVQI